MTEPITPPGVPAHRRSMINRADLVYWLKRDQLGSDELVRAADLLGFKLDPKPPSIPEPSHKTGYTTERIPGSRSSDTATPPAVSDPRFFRIASRERLAADPDKSPGKGEGPLSIRDVDVFTREDLTPAPYKPLDLQPLIAWARLWPVLKRHLRTSRRLAIDVPALIKQVAAGRLVRRLPRLKRVRWATRIELLSDPSDHLSPFQSDFDVIREALTDLVGVLSLNQAQVIGIAAGECLVEPYSEPDQRPWKMPPATTPVLILSDLGMLAGPRSRRRRDWLLFGKRLKSVGITPFVLAPVSPAHVDPELCGYFHIALWSSNSRLLAQHHRSDLGHDAQVDQLLTLLSPAVRVETVLLRALRHLLPADQADAGCEADVWSHADVHYSERVCAIRDDEERLIDHRKLFKTQPDHLKRQVLLLLRRHHAHLFPAIRHEETLIWASLVGDELREEFKDEIDEAEKFMRKTTRMLYDRRDDPDRLQHGYSVRHLDRSDPELRGENLYYSVMAAEAYRYSLDTGIPIQAGIDREELRRTLSGDSKRLRQCTLYQRGHELILAEEGAADIRAGSRYADVALIGDSVFVELNSDDAPASELLLQLPEVPKTLAILTPETECVRLQTEGEIVTVAGMTKPTWAQAIGRDWPGLFVDVEQHGIRSRVGWPEWDAALGQDEFGLYADLAVGEFVQRFRWINPGTFQMGSPVSEPERELWDKGNETLHQVTLTEGYWLAETACTQALWQTVMDDNPSYFKDDKNNPVEQVSWDQVQWFIEALNIRVPGLNACLPTEAQWEYACRAGTKTSFSFGENITPEQVNYNGKYPYAGGKKGQDRETTVSVKTLPPNPWGLCEMHGNVWEWCQDWYGTDYGTEAVTDPVGPEKGENRVLRGGSWIYYGRHVRSAYRGMIVPGNRSSYFGFRFALGQAACSRQESSKQEAASAADADRPSGSVAGQRPGQSRPEGKGAGWQDRLKDWWNKQK